MVILTWTHYIAQLAFSMPSQFVLTALELLPSSIKE